MKFKILSLLMSLAMIFGCAFGLTACGQQVTVMSAEINADGELIITMTDGTKTNLGSIKGEDGKDGADGKDGVDGNDGADGKDGIDGSDGKDGKDGAGIASAYIDGNGRLIIVLTTGEKIDCGTVSGSAEAAADLSFEEVKENGEVTGYAVTGLINNNRTAITVPSAFNGKPVVGIKNEAFSGCAEIVGVTIPDSVTSIGARAFADCAKLKNVKFGSGIKEVGMAAFARCEALISVDISDIGAWCEIAFESPASNPLYCAHKLYLNNLLLTELSVPDTVTEIGSFAFYECYDLVSVQTGNGVKSIGERAFYNCAAVESVTVGESAETIGELAFSDCASLKTLNFGNKLNSIGAFAFNRCTGLTEITIPSSVEEIGENAFAECSELRSLTMNYGLKSIGRGAFCGCFSLEKFIMPDSVTFIDYGILLNEQGIGFIPGEDGQGNLSEIRISNSLTELADYAFSKCNIRTIEIGSNVRKINYSSFYGCAFLESVVVPVSVKHISSYAFYECGALQTVFYKGTAAEWDSVFIGRNGNDNFRQATVYFYSMQKPAQSGNFWRYVDGVPTVWEN